MGHERPSGPPTWPGSAEPAHVDALPLLPCRYPVRLPGRGPTSVVAAFSTVAVASSVALSANPAGASQILVPHRSRRSAPSPPPRRRRSPSRAAVSEQIELTSRARAPTAPTSPSRTTPTPGGSPGFEWWQACSSTASPLGPNFVACSISSWTDTTITFAGFSGLSPATPATAPMVGSSTLRTSWSSASGTPRPAPGRRTAW